MFATIIYPAAPIRRKPDHRKEMVNQLLFGESVEVLKEKGPLWLKVRSLNDDYIGWVTRSLVHFTADAAEKNNIDLLCADLLAPIIINGQRMNIPFGSTLPGLVNGRGRIGELEYEFIGNSSNPAQMSKEPETLIALGKSWLQAPYLWGGRTILGVDCSGFVQVMMKMLGISMPRDAWQQAQMGEPIGKFKEARPGDLVFFDNKEDIVHVGILLGEGQILHSSGQVRIDQIDKRSVIHSVTGNRMQALKAIRRIFV